MWKNNIWGVKKFGRGYDEFPKKLNEIKTKDQARQEAIDFQHWAGEQNLSQDELIEYQHYFKKLAKKYHLTKEFRENGII